MKVIFCKEINVENANNFFKMVIFFMDNIKIMIEMDLDN